MGEGGSRCKFFEESLKRSPWFKKKGPGKLENCCYQNQNCNMTDGNTELKTLGKGELFPLLPHILPSSAEFRALETAAFLEEPWTAGPLGPHSVTSDMSENQQCWVGLKGAAWQDINLDDDASLFFTCPCLWSPFRPTYPKTGLQAFMTGVLNPVSPCSPPTRKEASYFREQWGHPLVSWFCSLSHLFLFMGGKLYLHLSSFVSLLPDSRISWFQ